MALQVVEFIFSTTTKDDHDFIVETPKGKLSRCQILSLKRKSWVHNQVILVYGHFLNDQEERKEVVKGIVFPWTYVQHVVANAIKKQPMDKARVSVHISMHKSNPLLKRENLERCDYIFFPMYRDDHYRVYVADMKNRKTFLLDSQKPNARVANEDHGLVGKVIFEYVTEFLKEQGVNCTLDEWEFNIANVPQQFGNDDFDVFACLYMELWVGHLPVEYKNSWHKQ